MKETLIVLMALAVTAALRKRSAAVRHWVLAMGLLCAGLSPLLGMVLPEWHPMNNRPGVRSSQDTAVPAVSTSVEFSIRPDQKASNAPPAFSRARALQVIWAGGTAVSVMVLLVGLGRLGWLASHARPVLDPRWKAMLGPVTLLQSGHPALLVTWGFVRPKIILPASAAEWPDDRMRIVLWHELAHIRRGDWCVQMLAELLRAAYWFNPIVWVACRRLRQESERACDDAVLRLGVDGADYAAELLALARDLRQPDGTLFSDFPAPAMARPSSLGRRVSAMLNDRIDRSPITVTARLAIVVALLLLAIPIATAQSFATLSGTLVDPSGAPIPNGEVVLSSAARQSEYHVKTAANGTFTFVGLPSGDYELDAKVPGFKTLHDNLTLVPGQDLRRQLQLLLGSLSEAITVIAGSTDQRREPSAAITTRVLQPAEPKPCVATATGGNIRPPKKLSDTTPEYPAAAVAAGAQGVVILSATIGLDGFLKDIDVLRDPGSQDLALAAVTAVREWKYSQTLLNCSPVEVKVTITTNFTLRP
jgi:TonB family protein